jgi:hypothetical protein
VDGVLEEEAEPDEAGLLADEGEASGEDSASGEAVEGS